jgi:hypothetical protein
MQWRGSCRRGRETWRRSRKDAGLFLGSGGKKRRKAWDTSATAQCGMRRLLETQSKGAGWERRRSWGLNSRVLGGAVGAAGGRQWGRCRGGSICGTGEMVGVASCERLRGKEDEVDKEPSATVLAGLGREALKPCVLSGGASP